LTVLYRSPTIIIDSHEWHVSVELRGRGAKPAPHVHYKFRPVSLRAYRWQPIAEWVGPKPKGMCNRLWKFRGHVALAMQSDVSRRRAAILGAAPRANKGRLRPKELWAEARVAA
jgi:hypothetical protein